MSVTNNYHMLNYLLLWSLTFWFPAMHLPCHTAKAEHDRKDRERQMKAEARRARDAQYASRGPSLSERAGEIQQCAYMDFHPLFLALLTLTLLLKHET